jgi:thioredoxin-like negative regulator of GroEL
VRRSAPLDPDPLQVSIAAWLLLALASCDRSPAAWRVPESIAAPSPDPPHPPHPPAIREGGFGAALEDARRAHQLVVLDFWASWCPPCMSMRASTFPHVALYPLADTFTWVSVDRDTDEGDALAKRLGVDGIPALFVFDPDVATPRARWNNSALPGPELADLLRAVSASPPVDGLSEIFASTLVSGHDERVTDADRARVRSLLERSPPTWPFTPFAAELLVANARNREAFDECVELGTRYADRLPAGSLRTAVVMLAHECAGKTKPPRTDVASALLDAGEKLVDDPATPILPFDRAWRYAALWHTRGKLLGDAAGAARVGQHWLAFLRNEQAQAGPAERATLAAPLDFALEVLGDKAAALDVLAEAARAEPESADALRRYVTALDEANRVDDAIAAVTHGIDAIPAPRRIPLLWAQAKLLGRKNDVARERATLDAAVALFPVTPSSPHFASVRKEIEERKEALHSAGK